MSEVPTGHFGRRGLHLLWTVPLAFVAGYLPASLARFERCGIDRCLGDPGGFDSPSASYGVTVATVAGLFMFAALAITPWLRPGWLRLSVGLILSVLVAGGWCLDLEDPLHGLADRGDFVLLERPTCPMTRSRPRAHTAVATTYVVAQVRASTIGCVRGSQANVANSAMIAVQGARAARRPGAEKAPSAHSEFEGASSVSRPLSGGLG